MRGYSRFLCILFFILTLTALSVGCTLRQDSRDIPEASMGNYSKDDFETIIVVESTYHDVYRIAPVKSLVVTSYGGYCDYPTETDGCIRIKFYGPNLIVGEIEDVFPPAES